MLDGRAAAPSPVAIVVQVGFAAHTVAAMLSNSPHESNPEVCQ